MKSETDSEKAEAKLPAAASSAQNTAEAAKKDTPDMERGPGKEGDLIIREGFPALYIPRKDGDEMSKQFQPMVTGDEPLPKHGFWSAEDILRFDSDSSALETLRRDCQTVFSARDKPDGASYSAGETYFIPSNMKPRCALEAIALKIFQEHTKDLEPGTFNSSQSGANWWTLVMDDNAGEATTSASAAGAKTTGLEDEYQDEGDDDDEVGLHFDADYELEEQTGNIMLHPRVATVTYLSDHGAPTLVLEQKSPPMDDLKKTTLEKGIKKAWLSHPQIGKHTAFDGRFLHGAPALYFPPIKNKVSVDDETKEPSAKRQKVVRDTKRYTLLVNVWLNHWVMDAGLLDDEVCASLTTPWEDDSSNLKGDDDYKPPFIWNKEINMNKEADMKKATLAPSNVDPAGEDEIALCNHNVTVKYNPLMEECHSASLTGSTVEITLEKNTITLHVGEELADDDDDEEVE